MTFFEARGSPGKTLIFHDCILTGSKLYHILGLPYAERPCELSGVSSISDPLKVLNHAQPLAFFDLSSERFEWETKNLPKESRYQYRFNE